MWTIRVSEPVAYMDYVTHRRSCRKCFERQPCRKERRLHTRWEKAQERLRSEAGVC